MPSWQALTRQQRIDLVAYIKSFSHRFQEEKPGTPVVIPAETSSTVQSVERGGELFQKMNCWSCHGKQGHGNGPSAIGLTDSKGYPITPYDFTSTTQFKCGEGDQDIFRVLMTGLDGTPMPSFSDALDPSQTWDLVHFVKTFRSSGRKTVFAKKANGNTGTTQQDINGNKGKVSGGKGDGNGHK
jgi:cytochrome c oxidase cbb3-type subunit 2